MRYLIIILVILTASVTGTAAQSDVSFLPDDLAVITPDNADQLVEVARIGRGRPYSVQWAPDGEKLKVISSTGHWVYDSFEELPHLCKDEECEWYRGTLTPRGRVKVATNDGKVKIQDADTGEEIWSFASEYGEPGWPLIFSPDGTRLAFVSERPGEYAYDSIKTLEVWDLETGERVASRQGITFQWEPVTSMVFSPDGKYLAWSSNSRSDDAFGGVWLWDMSDKAPRLMSDYPGFEVAFSPDGKWLIADLRIAYRLGFWDVQQVIESDEEPPPPEFLDDEYSFGGQVADFAFSPDSAVLAQSTFEGWVEIWDLQSKEMIVHFAVSGYGQLNYNPDGTKLAVLSDEALHLRGTQTYEELAVLSHFSMPVSLLQVNAAGDLLITGYRHRLDLPRVYGAPVDNTLSVWDIPSGNRHAHFEIKDDSYIHQITVDDHFTSFAYVRNGKDKFGYTARELVYFLNYDPDCKIGVCYLPSPNTAEIESEWETGVRFIPHSEVPRYAALRYSPMLEDQDGDPLRFRCREIACLFGGAFHVLPGSLHVIYSKPMKVIVKDIASREDDVVIFFSKSSPYHSVTLVALDSTGAQLVTGGEDGLTLWNIDPKEEIATFDVFGYYGEFSPDNALLAVSAGKKVEVEDYGSYWKDSDQVYLYDTTTGAELAVLEGHSDEIEQFAFTPDGKLLITGSWDGTVRFWGVPGE